MKMRKTLLPLILVSSVLCSSCSSYLPLQVGVWQSDQSIIFEEYDVTINTLRIEIIENDNPDHVYDDFNAVTDDGGEYLRSGLIIYIYADDITLIEYSLLGYTNGDWQSGYYLYEEDYSIHMRIRLNNDRKNKTTYFEAKLTLTYYGDNDPHTYRDGVSEKSNPSTVYLYEL